MHAWKGAALPLRWAGGLKTSRGPTQGRSSWSLSEQLDTCPTQHGVGAGQRRGDVEVRNYLRKQRAAGGLVFDLSITHDRIGSSCHVQQKGLLSHPQELDAPLRLAAQRKINSYRQQHADNQNISFSPPLSPLPPACTASFCAFFFYRPTERGRKRARKVRLYYSHGY